jgi:hypothetical protein
VLLDKTGTITVASGDLILCATDRPCGRSSTSCVASWRAIPRRPGVLLNEARVGYRLVVEPGGPTSLGAEMRASQATAAFAPTFARRDEVITTIVETTTYLCHVCTRGQGSEWTYYAVVAQCPKDGGKVSPCCER